jgi:hypothetical protein
MSPNLLTSGRQDGDSAMTQRSLPVRHLMAAGLVLMLAPAMPEYACHKNNYALLKFIRGSHFQRAHKPKQ